MIDHIFVDVIAAMKEALASALLEQRALEERFQIDVFLGDISFETSYSLPGEQEPPRVRADLSLEWPTWSQSAYRSWAIGESPQELPELIIEVALRLQRLVQSPDPARVLSAVGNSPPSLGDAHLERSGPTIEVSYDAGIDQPSTSVEVAYQGAYRIEEEVLETPERLQDDVAPLARWIASGLVRLADLDLPFLPAEEPGSSS